MIDTNDYINYIRSQGCRVCGKFPTDPDHLLARGMGGAGEGGTITGTVKDFSCIPLCRKHHIERHQLGLTKFQEQYKAFKLNVWKDAWKLVTDYFTR